MTTETALLGTPAAQLSEKISNKTARVGIIGLGYVGLPLAVEFARAGFTVTGIDLIESKVERINAGDSYLQDVSSSDVAELVQAGKLCATTDFSVVTESRHDQYLRADPAAQDQRPRYELYRVGLPGDRQVRPPRDAGYPGIDHLPRNHR